MATNNGLDIKFYDDSDNSGTVGIEVKMTTANATVNITMPSGNIYSTPGVETVFSGLLNIPEITTFMPVGTYVFDVTDDDGDTSSTTLYYSAPTFSGNPTLSFSSDLVCIESKLTVTENTTWTISYDSVNVPITFISPLQLEVKHASGDTVNCGTVNVGQAATEEIFPICAGVYNVNLTSFDGFYPISITPTGTITTDTDVELYIAPNLNINQITVDCNNRLCSLKCCLKSLFEKYKEFRNESKELELEYYNKTKYALQLARLAKRALMCGKNDDFNAYVLEMGEIMECSDCLDC